jgi:glycosyltransferase involved in cell wall biosynthesis
MKILYDHQMFLLQKYGGITKYFCELIKNISTENKTDLSVLFSENQHLKDLNALKKTHFALPRNEFRGKGRLKTYFYNINKTYSLYKISSSKYDLLHPTYYDTYFLKNLKKPYIITVHDLIEFKFREQYKNNSLIPQMKKIILNADRIISISENTKKDLIEILNINPENIDVIYHGFNRPDSIVYSNDLGRYILFVGYRGGYKNFSSLAKAFSNLAMKDSDLKLICVGNPFVKEEIELLKRLDILKKTVAVGVNENKLNQLYSNALVFVYPTLYEGFGMPILEAFANNCPISLSNCSSLPEVAGNAAVYFDPNDPDSILESITKIIYNPDFSNQLVEKGKEQLTHFSWIKCAEQTLESYKRTVS